MKKGKRRGGWKIKDKKKARKRVRKRYLVVHRREWNRPTWQYSRKIGGEQRIRVASYEWFLCRRLWGSKRRVHRVRFIELEQQAAIRHNSIISFFCLRGFTPSTPCTRLAPPTFSLSSLSLFFLALLLTLVTGMKMPLHLRRQRLEPDTSTQQRGKSSTHFLCTCCAKKSREAKNWDKKGKRKYEGKKMSGSRVERLESKKSMTQGQTRRKTECCEEHFFQILLSKSERNILFNQKTVKIPPSAFLFAVLHRKIKGE